MKTRILEREGIKGAGASADKCLKELGLHRYVAEIVSKRVPLSDIDAFLNPDIRDMHSPDLFNDMGKAVELIHKAVRENRQICVYGDYDVDGICWKRQVPVRYHPELPKDHLLKFVLKFKRIIA